VQLGLCLKQSIDRYTGDGLPSGRDAKLPREVPADAARRSG
jgi:hypothetical protein